MYNRNNHYLQNRRNTTGRADVEYPMSFSIDQRDPYFPKPYIHKVGTVGQRSPGRLFKSLGIQNTGQPGLFQMVGINRNETVGKSHTRQPNINGEIVCIDPNVWNSGDSIYDNVGRARYCDIREKDVLVSYYPISYESNVSLEKYIPVTSCIVCTNKDDFFAWCCHYVEIDDAELMWEDMFPEETGPCTGGQGDPF